MNPTRSYTLLPDIFEKSLNVDLLAEEISTCNRNDDALKIKKVMMEKDYDVYGVEEKGKIVGYVLRKELSNGTVGDFYKSFRTEDLISDSTSLIELVEFLKNQDYLFILEKNHVNKIVTIADLHKQPIRMMAFSFITLLEMFITALIRETFPNESWKEKLSEERLSKAKEMMQKRKEQNEALSLLDNTQLGDKGTIIRKTPELVKRLGFESNNKCKDFFTNIENLRNNIAHAQEEIYDDNRELIDTILQINRLLKAIPY